MSPLRSRCLRWAVGAAAAGVCLVVGSASATILVARDLTDLTLNASAVVLGRVLAVHGEWDPARSRIYTLASVGVERTLKGAAEPTVTVRALGGEIPGEQRGYRVPGAPRFEPGEEVLLFLRPEPAADEGGGPTKASVGTWQVVGWEQGKFAVAVDPASGQRMVHPRINVLLVHPVTKQAVPTPLASMTLEELERRIQAILGLQGR